MNKIILVAVCLHFCFASCSDRNNYFITESDLSLIYTSVEIVSDEKKITIYLETDTIPNIDYNYNFIQGEVISTKCAILSRSDRSNGIVVIILTRHFQNFGNIGILIDELVYDIASGEFLNEKIGESYLLIPEDYYEPPFYEIDIELQEQRIKTVFSTKYQKVVFDHCASDVI